MALLAANPLQMTGDCLEGGGKSLVFQLPALAQHNDRGVITIVIVPLVALRVDQVTSINKQIQQHSTNPKHQGGVAQGLKGTGLNSSGDTAKALEIFRKKLPALLYMTPEKLKNPEAP